MTAAIIVVIVLVLDQLTKFMVQNSAVLQTQSIPVIPGFFYLTYVKNTGAAWPAFADKTQLLALVSAVAVGVMLWYVITRKPKKWILFALALMIGGTGWLCSKLHDPKGGTVGCCGCGQCAKTGECVMTKKKTAKKGNVPS